MNNCFKALILAASCCMPAGLVHAQNDSMRTGTMEDKKAANARMLIDTLSEEKTEIQALAAQQAQFKKMGDPESQKIAWMFGRWIKEHKAAGPPLMKLIKANGGDPMQAKILKPPVLGDKMKMLMVTHKDHEAAVMTSQMRHGMTNSGAIKTAMRKRANLARKHIKQMMPYMDMKKAGGHQMMDRANPDGGDTMTHHGENTGTQ